MQKLQEKYVDHESTERDLNYMYRHLARANQSQWVKNDNRMAGLYTAFQLAIGLLGLEVVCWLIDLGAR